MYLETAPVSSFGWHNADLRTPLPAYVDLERHPIGRMVLQERPDISEATLPDLSRLPDGSLGRAYHVFMGAHGFSPDERTRVQFVDDVDLA